MSVSVLCQFFFFGKCVAAVTIKIYRYDSHIDRHERLKMAFPFSNICLVKWANIGIVELMKSLTQLCKTNLYNK